jgi:hypothetical protein
MKSEENPFYYQDFLFDEKDFNVRGAILNIYSDRIFAYYGAGDDDLYFVFSFSEIQEMYIKKRFLRGYNLFLVLKEENGKKKSDFSLVHSSKYSDLEKLRDTILFLKKGRPLVTVNKHSHTESLLYRNEQINKKISSYFPKLLIGIIILGSIFLLLYLILVFIVFKN